MIIPKLEIEDCSRMELELLSLQHGEQYAYPFNKEGYYTCAKCNKPLYSSKDKLDYPNYPSFKNATYTDVVREDIDYSFGMKRIELSCTNCAFHLGNLQNGNHTLLSLCLKFNTGIPPVHKSTHKEFTKITKKPTYDSNLLYLATALGATSGFILLLKNEILINNVSNEAVELASNVAKVGGSIALYNSALLLLSSRNIRISPFEIWGSAIGLTGIGVIIYLFGKENAQQILQMYNTTGLTLFAISLLPFIYFQLRRRNMK